MLHAYKIKFMIDNVQYNFKAKYSNKFEDFLKKISKFYIFKKDICKFLSNFQV